MRYPRNEHLNSPMLPVDIVLHPSWWHHHEGITFDEDFFFHPARRVEAERQMMKSSDEVIIVADQTKFGKRALAQLGTWDDVNRLVTDDGLDAHWRAVLEERGVTVVIASVEEGQRGIEEASR